MSDVGSLTGQVARASNNDGAGASRCHRLLLPGCGRGAWPDVSPFPARGRPGGFTERHLPSAAPSDHVTAVRAGTPADERIRAIREIPRSLVQ